MQKFIQNLRQKPETERRNILHILIIMFSVVLIILWAYGLGKTVSNSELSKKVQEDLQPFSKLTDDLSTSYYEISAENLQGNTSKLNE